MVRTNTRLNKVNSELVSEKRKHTKKRATASKAVHAKEEKIKLLDKEKAASLLREKDAEASLQNKIDKNEIQDKAMLRDTGKLAAVVQEKEKSNLQNTNIKAERGSGWSKH